MYRQIKTFSSPDRCNEFLKETGDDVLNVTPLLGPGNSGFYFAVEYWETLKDLIKADEVISDEEKLKVARKAIAEAAPIFNELVERKRRLRSEAASIADDVQKETPKEYGDRTEDEALAAISKAVKEASDKY